MNNFALVLRELMDERSIDANFLAKKIDLSDASIIYRWLKGELSLLSSTAIKLANYFNCSLDYLFGLSDEYKNGDFKECPPFDVQFRKVLENQKVSQNKLTKDKIISRGSLNGWLNKKQTPHIESIIKLADYLKISMDYLVGREK